MSCESWGFRACCVSPPNARACVCLSSCPCNRQTDHLDEPINALRFGERTATMENHITRDSHTDLDDVVRQVQAQLAASRHTLAALAKDGQAGFMSLR